MKKNIPLLFIGFVMMLTSCHVSKYIYLEDMPLDQTLPITHKEETRIKPGDRLDIHVSCQKMDLAIPFNSHSYSVAENGEATAKDTPPVKGYLVDEEGFINFPVLGQLQVSGLTMPQVSAYIKQLLVEGRHIPDAVVETTINNFTIYGLGALSPGKLVVPDAKINILQAVAQMGDIKQGKIHKVRVIREDEGMRMEFDIDLNKKDLFDSPAFYLQQNDIVYAEPKKGANKTVNGTMTAISLAAVLASIAYSTAFIFK